MSLDDCDQNDVITPDTVAEHKAGEVRRQARALELDGSFEQAFDLFRRAEEQWPDKIALKIGVARTAFKTGQYGVALSRFQQALRARPDDAKLAVQVFKTQLELHLPDAAFATISAAAEQHPDDRQVQGLYAWACTRTADMAEPDDADLKKTFEDPNASFLELTSAIKAAHAEHSVEEIAAMHGLLAARFPSDHTKRSFIKMLVGARMYEEALERTEEFFGENSKLIDLHRKAVCHAALGQVDLAEKTLLLYAQNEPSPHKILATAIAFVGGMDDLRLAQEIVQRLNARYHDPAIDNLLTFLSAIRPASRGLMAKDAFGEECVISPKGSSDLAVLAFGGFRGKTGGFPFSLLDMFFAGHGVAVAQLTDRSGNMFLNGIKPLGVNVDDTISQLRQTLATMGLTRVVTLGSSGGGIGAIRYGAKLNAERVVSFSGPTNLTESFLEQHGDTRARAVIKGLNRRLGPERLDLRRILEQETHRPPLYKYFCADQAGDRAQAENIAHLPEVELHPIDEYSQHDSICAALGTGQLLSQLNAILKNA
jgi:tetratricopeptide (TPR) repeat protein